MTPIPLANNAKLLVLPVEPQFNKTWGQGVRRDGFYSVHVDIETPDGWLWIRCPYKIGETYPIAGDPDKHATVTAIECRRVQAITKAECIAAGYEFNDLGESIRELGYGWWFPWLKAFTATHGREAYDENHWSFFIQCDTKGPTT